MAMASNSFQIHSSSSFSRHKTTQLKLLELIRSEKPCLHVVTLPNRPVHCGKNRLKFPDPNNDCYVMFSLTGQTSRVSLPVHYKLAKTEEVELEDDDCPYQLHLHGLWYSLQIESVRRQSLESNEIFLEIPEKSYCCYPLTNHRRCDEDSSETYGFWFRFFSEETRYRIHVVLKLEGGKLFPKEFFKNDPYLINVIDENGVVCSVDFDICTGRLDTSTGPEKKLKSVSFTSKVPNTASSTMHLYSNEKYNIFIKSVQEIKFEAKYDELERLLSNASARYQADYDMKVVVLLEQGLVACRKRFCDYAKELFKNAVDLVGRCQNKILLTGRIYVYLSEVHFNEGFIGNAGESLAVARKYLENFDLCEDLGDLCFCEGQILMVYAKRTPAFLKNLIPEAKQKFLEAGKNFSKGSSVSQMGDKLNCVYVKIASLELQPIPDEQSKELVVTPEQVSRAKSYLDKVQESFASLSQQTKLYYYLCSAELCLVANEKAKAKEMFNKALELAENIGLQKFVHVDIALEEVKRCLEMEDDVDGKDKFQPEVKPAKLSLAEKSDNDGYLGDRSDEDI